MSVAENAVPEVGAILRRWRSARRLSQLALALEAGVSARHLSFVETGRASPSREMVLLLAEALDVPLRERNALLAAAGFASVYSETPLAAPEMSNVRAALEHILAANAACPTLVVNRRYDVLDVNPAARRFVAFFAPHFAGPMNVARLLLDADGLRPHVVNWREVTQHVATRLRGELGALTPRSAEDDAILGALDAARKELEGPSPPLPGAILVPLRLRRGAVELELFTTISTLGTPLDITLQELRIETLFPANGAAKLALAAIVSASS